MLETAAIAGMTDEMRVVDWMSAAEVGTETTLDERMLVWAASEAEDGTSVAVETEVVLAVGRCWRDGAPPLEDEEDGALSAVELGDLVACMGVPLATPLPSLEAARVFWSGVPAAVLAAADTVDESPSSVM